MLLVMLDVFLCFFGTLHFMIWTSALHYFLYLIRDGRGPSGEAKYMIYAAIGTACVLGALTFLEFNSREITWKEFINK